MNTEAAPVLSASHVTAGYGLTKRVAAVLHDVSLTVAPGTTLGVVGESGSGKSTLARVLVGQLTPWAGEVFVDGVIVQNLRRAQRRMARRDVQLIPQDPYASLDPRMTIAETLLEALNPAGGPMSRYAARITELLQTVSLDPAVAGRLPHEFSGGQRQRVAIARALAVAPKLIIADEVTSALDASIQAEILKLLKSLRREKNLSCVFVTHDLAIAADMCDEIAVLYLGRIVEHGPVSNILTAPQHPYTKLLVDSVPDPYGAFLTASAHDVITVVEPPDPANPPSGCPFHPRCAVGPRVHESRSDCVGVVPPLEVKDPRRASSQAACHYPLHISTETAALGQSVV